jgi:MFS family permease
MTTAAPARPLALAGAGIGVVGVAFGMARYGFGLLAPDIRGSFSLSSGRLGLLAAASYVAYLVTSVTAGLLTARLGPRTIVAAGGACAVVGMVAAGLAPTPAVLFVGLLVAGASAGLVFPPFADVVARSLQVEKRPRVLAAISSGTGWGVAVAAPVAIAVGTSWRTAWLLFAALAGVATVWALLVLPGRALGGREAVALRLRWFVCPRSGRLLIGAGLIGVASSVYWTFAVDRLVAAGGVSSADARVFLGLVGVATRGRHGGGRRGAPIRRGGGVRLRAGSRSRRAGPAGPIAGQRRGGRRVGDPVRRGLQRRGGRGGDLERARLREPSFRGPGGDPVRAGGGRPDRSSGAGRGGRRGRLRRRILRCRRSAGRHDGPGST